jgi:hypothetical protein
VDEGEGESGGAAGGSEKARVAGTLLMDRELMGLPSIKGQRRAELWMSCRKVKRDENQEGNAVGFGMEKKKRWAKLSGCDGEGKEKMTECWELLSQLKTFFFNFHN